MGHIGPGTKDILLWKKTNVFLAGVMEKAQKHKTQHGQNKKEMKESLPRSSVWTAWLVNYEKLKNKKWASVGFSISRAQDDW